MKLKNFSSINILNIADIFRFNKAINFNKINI